MTQIDQATPKRRGRPRKYPWLEIEVGESFEVEGKTAYDMSKGYVDAGQRYGRKFAGQTFMNGGQVSCRITRTA